MTAKQNTTKKPATLKLIEGAALIDKAIASIKNRGAKLDQDIQIAGLSVLAHVQAHGDVTLADRLYNAMPNGSRRNALASWMLAFGKVRKLDKANASDAEALKAGRVFGYNKEANTDMQGAQDKPWHEFKHVDGSIDEAFDVKAAVHHLLKRIQNAQKKGVHIEHAELVETLAKIGG